jgi:hypothetical protein
MRPYEPRYDVALSFAGEQRSYVVHVAEILRDSGIKVFYDDYEKTALWGKDLYSHLDYVYRTASRFCVVFISEAYARKVWTNHERESAQARALEENQEYVLPVRFDQTDVPGLRPTIGYLDLAEIGPADLAQRIQEKLGPKPIKPGFPRQIPTLYKALGMKGGRKKQPERWDDIRTVARSFYDALVRMNDEERRAVAGVMIHGCSGELPEHVHASLDLVRRMIGLPPAQIMAALGSVRSLNIKVALRDPVHADTRQPGELLGDDRDIALSFWSRAAPHVEDSTTIAYHTIREVAKNFCDDHAIREVCALNFHMLGNVKHSGCGNQCHARVDPAESDVPQLR